MHECFEYSRACTESGLTRHGVGHRQPPDALGQLYPVCKVHREHIGRDAAIVSLLWCPCKLQ